MNWVSISPLGSKALPQHIRGEVTSKNNDRLLEIGNYCAASSELLALCALAPEISEFLERFESPLAVMLLEKWRSLSLDIWRDQHQSEKPAEQAS
jgi:hypothetical protein